MWAVSSLPGESTICMVLIGSGSVLPGPKVSNADLIEDSADLLMTVGQGLSMALNGALAGLVGITAGCYNITGGWSLVVGAVAGVLCVEGVLLIDKIKIDDPVGAITVHGICGMFGTIAVGLVGYGNAATGEEPIGLLVGGGASQLGIQAMGTLAGVAFAFIVGSIVWLALKFLVPGGVRVSESHELEGLDIAECGVEAYNDELRGIEVGAAAMAAAPAE